MEFRIMEKRYKTGTKPSECKAEVKLTVEEKNDIFGENRQYFADKTNERLGKKFGEVPETVEEKEFRIFFNQEWFSVVKVISLLKGDLSILVDSELYAKNLDFNSQKNYIQQLNEIIKERNNQFEMIEHKIVFTNN
jgi:hypothetical protein